MVLKCVNKNGTLLDLMVRLFEVLWHGAGELLAGRIVFEVGVMVVKLLVVERVLLADAEILFSDWAGEQSSCTPLLKNEEIESR